MKSAAKKLSKTSLKYINASGRGARLFLSILLLAFFSFCFAFFISGYLPDREAERVVEQLYKRDSHGVIVGEDTIIKFTGHSTLAFFLHGFMESPEAFSNVIAGLEAKKLPIDYYAPRTPFHAMNLQTMNQFSTKEILQFFADEIEKYANKYKEVILIGYSMGGAILIALDQKGLIPKNCSLILYAPGVYIKGNDLGTRLGINVFKYWRNYCNYKDAGCSYPTYQSGDSEARDKIAEEKNLRYRVGHATLELFNLDLMARDHLAHINRPYSLIIAEDDNRVSFEMAKKACEEDAKYCTLYPFSDGKHLIHWGKNEQKFIDLLAELILKYQQSAAPTSTPAPKQS